MQESPWSNQLVVSLLALTLIIILVHGFYVVLVRPVANTELQAQAELIAANPDAPSIQPSFFIIIKDYEQEACFIMLFFAMSLIAFKARLLKQMRQMLTTPLIQIAPGTSILPNDCRSYLRTLESLPPEQQSGLLPRVLMAALQRFETTSQSQDADKAVNQICEQEADQMDSELSMIRYIVWAIPSIGFIGTVRGIGRALGEAHRAIQGDIAGVTANLGVAFNSTFVALILTIILMFLMHQLQYAQEKFVADSRSHVDQHLLRQMRTLV